MALYRLGLGVSKAPGWAGRGKVLGAWWRMAAGGLAWFEPLLEAGW